MIAKKKENAIVWKQAKLTEDIYEMWIETDLAQDAKAGQFISVYPKSASTLLPRPISIAQIDKKKKRLCIIYRIAGKGTTEFSTYQKGDTISILGTLGNGFPMELINSEYQDQKVFLMGGGIGIPPMLQTAKDIRAEKHIYVGYRDANLFLKEELEEHGMVYVATEDGSIGTKGNVMDAIKVSGQKPNVILACGPMPMLRAVKEYARQEGIEAYISLEERMACGVGACLGCVCKTKNKDHHSHVNNSRICTDGPVFRAQEVEI